MDDYLVVCIDKLKQMVNNFVKKELIERVTIGNMVIMLLYHVDATLFLANNLKDAKNLIRAIEMFYRHVKMSVNSSKMKIMLIKSQNKERPCVFYYNLACI